jgi:hypothetical protein
MKTKTGVCLVFLFMLFPVLGCHAQDAAAPKAGEDTAKLVEQAKPKEEPNTWDFGKIKKDSTEERQFIFKNETGRLLTVTGVNTSCGCTGSTIKDKTLVSGMSTEVAVKFNSKGYAVGPVTQNVYIANDDPLTPVIKFTVKIEVVE